MFSINRFVFISSFVMLLLNNNLKKNSDFILKIDITTVMEYRTAALELFILNIDISITLH